MNDQLKQLELMMETYDKFTHGMASEKDVQELSSVFLGMIKDIKEQLEKMVADNLDATNSEIDKMKLIVRDIEAKVEQADLYTKTADSIDIKATVGRLNDDIGQIRTLIAQISDLSKYDIKLSDIELQLLKITNGEYVVEKINNLPTVDDKFKIDASHIKNLPKVKEKTFNGNNYLSTLADVSIAGISTNQSIRWNGTYWEAFTPGTGSGGTDIIQLQVFS